VFLDLTDNLDRDLAVLAILLLADNSALLDNLALLDNPALADNLNKDLMHKTFSLVAV
tara:strand:+ start:568 stop:741 length:174 start_codon:yes stop_codon:yes gene_type:complete